MSEKLEKDMQELKQAFEMMDDEETKQASMLINLFPLFKELAKQEEEKNERRNSIRK